MAEPTLADSQISTFTDTASSETSATVTWSAGSLVLVFGVIEDNTGTIATPTVAGLTFSLVTNTNTGSNCRVYCWQATAAGAGSGAILASRSGVTHSGIWAVVYNGSTGLGTVQLMASTGTTNATQSLARSGNNSAVACCFGDFQAINDTSVTANPGTGGTVRLIQVASGAMTSYGATWTDQGASGSTSYGISGYTATAKWIGIVVEILGTVSATKAPPVYGRNYRPQMYSRRKVA